MAKKLGRRAHIVGTFLKLRLRIPTTHAHQSFAA